MIMVTLIYEIFFVALFVAGILLQLISGTGGFPETIIVIVLGCVGVITLHGSLRSWRFIGFKFAMTVAFLFMFSSLWGTWGIAVDNVPIFLGMMIFTLPLPLLIVYHQVRKRNGAKRSDGVR